MTVGPGRLVILCGLLPTLVTALLSLTRPAFLTSLEYGTYDRLLRASDTAPPSNRIVIVDIDNRSLTSIGQWPWRRDVLGQLIDRLRAQGAATVALDIMFAEPDRYDANGVSPDETLAATLRDGGVVLGYALTFDGVEHSPRDCVRHPLGLGIIRQDDEPTDGPLFEATGAICNLPVLTQAAGASGFLNAMKKSPNMAAADIFPREARSNRNVFYDSRTGAPRTLKQVYAFFDQKFQSDVSGDSIMTAGAGRTNNAETASAGLRMRAAAPAIVADETDPFTRLAALMNTNNAYKAHNFAAAGNNDSVLRMSDASGERRDGWQIIPPTMYNRLSLSPAQLMMLSDFSA